jgi:hypothetical protein
VPALLEKPRIFERGDHFYMVAPVQRIKPSVEEIESYTFGSAIEGLVEETAAALGDGLKKKAPNENIVWFRGQYVEADNPNANGAQWTAEELGIKSLTPMLMPVTVMHDPRTAIGTIADVKLLTPEKDKVPRSRIDTILALWGHRFPEPVNEANVNAERGTLMQSMECYSPWYACSVCGAQFQKLPQGAEQARWCDHLKASNPSAGYVDLGASQSPNASRILGDVCFTGTGLIFGTRGAVGAYDEAYLDRFEEEVASHHHTVHLETAQPQTSPPLRSERMGLVQIEESELAAIRKERDDAKAEAAKLPALQTQVQDLGKQVEALEAEKKTAEGERDQEKQRADGLEEQANQQALREKRMSALGTAFTGKLGEITKSRLQEQAGTMDDTAWDERLKEVEETTGVKRDDKAEGDTTQENAGLPDFKPEEIARALPTGGGGPGNQPSKVEQSQVVGNLAGLFSPSKAKS